MNWNLWISIACFIVGFLHIVYWLVDRLVLDYNREKSRQKMVDDERRFIKAGLFGKLGLEETKDIISKDTWWGSY